MALPGRIRLSATVMLTALIVPMIGPGTLPDAVSVSRFAGLLLTEVTVGLLLGLSTRLLVHALQLAGTIAAQSTALTQIAGPNVAPDPMPAMGNALMIAGVTLAMTTGLHIKVVMAIAQSYQVVGFGDALRGEDVASWGLEQAVAALTLGFSMAAPFLIAAFLYNVALGIINRAMPQLMVAFVGAPAIVGLTLLMFVFASPVILMVWNGQLDAVLAMPLGQRP